jgi:hypothetical protein
MYGIVKSMGLVFRGGLGVYGAGLKSRGAHPYSMLRGSNEPQLVRLEAGLASNPTNQLLG